MTGSGLSAFVVGFVAGAAVFWRMSKVVERFRRARRDFRTARAGIRTLAEMVVSRGWEAVKLGLLAAAILVVVSAAWYQNRPGR